MVDVVPRLRAAEKILATIFQPTDRILKPPGQLCHHDVLWVEMHLGAEPAADRRAEHAQPRIQNPERLRQSGAQQMGRLRRSPHGQGAVERVDGGHDTASLQGSGGTPRMAERLPQSNLRPLQCTAHIALFVVRVKDDVVGQLLVQARCVRSHTGLGIHHRRQWLIGDSNRIEGIFCQVAVAGHDSSDGLAHETDLVEGERRPHALPVTRIVHHRSNGVNAAAKVGAGHDRLHPRDTKGAAGVDRHQAGVSVRTSQKGHDPQAGHTQVAHEARLTLQKGRVFRPLDIAAHVASRHQQLRPVEGRLWLRNSPGGGHAQHFPRRKMRAAFPPTMAACASAARPAARTMARGSGSPSQNGWSLPSTTRSSPTVCTR